MDERYGEFRMLVEHFFRRFFDNDTIQVDGDTQTTVVRALAIVAMPGLMIAFFLQNQYPRPLWGAIGDQYFFVMFSFVVMGAVSIFEWEMLFPDRLDFLVLSPLSLKPLQMLAAKATALISFLALFLVGSNLFGTLVLSAVSRGNFFRQLYAHGIAVLLAGVFAALLFLALGGVLLCVLDAARFRMASPIMQMLSVTALVLLVLHYVQYGDSMETLLSQPLRTARWLPPFWFLGVYEQLLHGDAAAPFAHEMARYAIRGTATAALVVLLTYPLAWARMRRMAVEGGSHRQGAPSRWWARLVHEVIRLPGERAAFHFIGQTIARNNRYQVYLAMYGGTGLALAVACAVTFCANGGSLQPVLFDKGLHAMMPLLLFWVIAGLRTAFAFPLNLPARWVFRITGASISECTAAARKWVFWCAAGVLGCVVAVLRMAGWDMRHLAVQIVCGLCLCLLLTDGFFFFQQSVPFNQPRMPGRTNFPLMLTLYIGVFPLFVFGMIRLEMSMEKNLAKLLLLGVTALVIHVALNVLRRGSEEVEEEMEGYEGEFQVLGLS
ncbi:MAG TPA: hypothetical protein VGG18_05525 [Granulicella sp.]|jgi:hypothetical protein